MNPAVRAWVNEIESLTTPSSVVFCDGSKGEQDRLIAECLASGELIELNQQKLPGCYPGIPSFDPAGLQLSYKEENGTYFSLRITANCEL